MIERMIEMKWKNGVTIEKGDGWNLHLGNRVMPVAQKDVYLARVIAQGKGNIEQLKVLIANAEGVDEIAAALGLAQFALDYGDFIAEDTLRDCVTN